MQRAERSVVALAELANRLARHMSNGTVPRSHLEQCFDSLRFSHDLRAEALQALADARIAILEDLPAEASDAVSEPRPPSEQERMVQRTRPQHCRDPRQAARHRLARDEKLPESRLPKILLSADEEVGLTLLVRPDGKPLEAGELANLNGEPRRAADALVLHNLGLVHATCRAYTGQGLDYEDLVQSALPGLLRAVELFDPSAGFKFSTYAMHWIRQAVTRAIANEGRAVRLPVYMWELVRRVVATREQMLQAGRRPSPRIIAEQLDMNLEKVIECLRLAPGVVSLDTPLGDDQFTLGDLVDAQADVAEHIEVNGLFPDDIERLLEALTEREADVVRRRYGLGPHGESQRLEDIGTLYGVTRERIRQVEAKAMKKIRQALQREGLRFKYIDPETGKPPQPTRTAAPDGLQRTA